ncbi:hypothetical protein R6Q59_010470 [Mikania micrantha]
MANPQFGFLFLPEIRPFQDRKMELHSYWLIGVISYVIAEIRDKQLKSSEDFVWALEVPLTGKFITDLEFLDLKTASPNVILPPISSVNF